MENGRIRKMKTFLLCVVLLLAAGQLHGQPSVEFLLPRTGEVYTDRIPVVVVLKLPKLASYSLSVDTLQMMNVNASGLVEPRLTEFMASAKKIDDVLVCFGTVGDGGWYEGEHTFIFFAFDSNHTPVAASCTATFRRSQEPYIFYKDFKTVRDTVTPVTRHVTRDTIAVHGGWNMVGGLPYSVPVDSIITTTPVSSFFGFNSVYLPVKTLEPNVGYWVKAERAGLLVVVSKWF